MVAGDCCDMSGCIAAFEAIDPKVERIDTVSGNAPDTSYEKRHGEWKCIRSPITIIDDDAGNHN